jgi:hypothetical protein
MMKNRTSGVREVRRFEVEEVVRLGAAGIFRDGERLNWWQVSC